MADGDILTAVQSFKFQSITVRIEYAHAPVLSIDVASHSSTLKRLIHRIDRTDREKALLYCEHMTLCVLFHDLQRY